MHLIKYSQIIIYTEQSEKMKGCKVMIKSITLKNGLNLEISNAKKEDAAGLIEYLNIIGGESDNLLFGRGEFQISVKDEEDYIDNIAASKVSVLLVGKIANEIVSVACLDAPNRQRIAHQADISVSVKQKYWNIGVATNMINELILRARQNGITKVLHLGVKADNENAILLYEKLGFKKIGEYKKFFKIGDKFYDEILMNLYL